MVPDCFKCNQCGAQGEHYFSWDGICLRCEDEAGEDTLFADDNWFHDADMEAR